MAIVCVDSSMTPVAATGDTMLNAVIEFSDDKSAGMEVHDARDKDKIIKNMRTKNLYFISLTPLIFT